MDNGPNLEEAVFVEDAGPFSTVLPPRRFLLLRDGSQEPVDDMEFDYLTHVAHDFELIMEGALQQKSERRIAQTLRGPACATTSVPSRHHDRFTLLVRHAPGACGRRFLHAYPLAR
ncbi:MAG: hypothetical protein ACLTSX_08155 [Collinsella sp.]